MVDKKAVQRVARSVGWKAAPMAGLKVVLRAVLMVVQKVAQVVE